MLCCPAGALPPVAPVPLGPEETLHFDGGVSGGLAVSGEYEYWAGVRYTPDKPCTLRAIIFYQHDASAEDNYVRVYGPGTTSRPGSQLAVARYSAAGTRRWKRVDLSSPVALDSGIDFWSAVATTYYTGDHPLGVDAGPIVLWRGGYIKVPLMGETWYQLSDPPFYNGRNWNQRALVVSASGIEEELGPTVPAQPPGPTFIRGVLNLTPAFCTLTSDFVLLDASGRRVLDLHPGPNDVSRLAPGVYFVREAGPPVPAVRRVILTGP